MKNSMGNVCRVLFVCTGNTCRSVMAEAFFRQQWKLSGLPAKVEACSAGLFTLENLSASQDALELLRREGLDIENHRSRNIDKEMIEQAHYVFTMTVAHKEALLRQFSCHNKIWTLGEYGDTGNDIADPYGGGRDAYELAAWQIKNSLHGIINRLKKEFVE